MKRIIVALLLSYNIYSFDCINSNQCNRIVEAIRRAENSKQYPYGIRSINTYSNEELARKICRKTVENNYIRWQKSGKTNDFIVFLGNRYCPPQLGGVNTNWVKNVRFFLK